MPEDTCNECSLQATPTRWREAHRDQLQDWSTVKVVLLYRFSLQNEVLRNIPIYNGCTSPQDHVAHYSSIWRADGLASGNAASYIHSFFEKYSASLVFTSDFSFFFTYEKMAHVI